MEAKARSLTFLGQEGQVKIPFFQRGYVWDEINWEDMISDLLEINKPHFLGSLILQQQEKVSGDPKSLLVIDGQQRLTTLSILLKAIYDSFSENTKKNSLNEIIKYLFYKKNATDECYSLKICHSHVDAEYYERVIGEIRENQIVSLSEEDFNLISDKSHKILQCYKFFKNRMTAQKEDNVKALFNSLLNDENKILVVIDLTAADNIQTIFDTINNAGVRLSGTDIVKNALFQKAMSLLRKETVISLYEKHWDRVFSQDETSLSFWSKKKSTGRLKRDNSEILLQSIAVIKGIYDPDKHKLEDLPKLYKEKIESLNRETIENFIKEIDEYALNYRKQIPHFEKDTLFSYEDNLKRLFHILDVCDISTFHPYILFLLKKYENDKIQLDKKLKSLEVFVVKRMILKKEVKGYNKLCSAFINDETLVDNQIKEYGDQSIISSLEKINNKNATLLLFYIELFRRHADRMRSEKDLKYDYSLEHIMPQKWEEHWEDVAIQNQDDIAFNDVESAKKFRNEKIYSIGNLTLLNSRLNASLSNHRMDKKIQGEGRIKGMKDYNDLSITKEVLENYKINNLWNEKIISERTKKLGLEILKIWENPQHPIPTPLS